MIKRIFLPILMLAATSLNGMARLSQQALPALRHISRGRQPLRLPATMPKTCPAGMRLLSSSSRTQGGYAGSQQAAFGGREALLLGGVALAGKTVYDYWDTSEGKALKRAYAAEQEYPTQDVLKNFLQYLATSEDLHNLEEAFYAHPELLPLVKQKIDRMSEKEFFAFANAAETGSLVIFNKNDLLPVVIKKIVNLPEESGFFSSRNFATFMTQTTLGKELGDIAMNEFYMFPVEAALLGQKIISLSDKNFVQVAARENIETVIYIIEYNPHLIEALAQKINGLSEHDFIALHNPYIKRPLNVGDHFRHVGSSRLRNLIHYLERNNDMHKTIAAYGPYIVAMVKNSDSAIEELARQYNEEPIFKKFIDDAYNANKGTADELEFEKIIRAAYVNSRNREIN